MPKVADHFRQRLENRSRLRTLTQKNAQTMSGSGDGAEPEVYNPGMIVRAILSEETNGVLLHPIQLEYTYTFLSDLVAGSGDAEVTKQAMPAGSGEWMATFSEAWEQASSKAWPSFIKARCEIWSGAASSLRSSRPTSPSVGGVVAGTGGARAPTTARSSEDERIAEMMHGLVVSDHDVPKAIEDIKAQRISGVRIMALSLALVSGRVHPNGESSDLRFGSDLRLCPSVRQQRKAGVSTFEDVLKTTKAHSDDVKVQLEECSEAILRTKNEAGLQLQIAVETCCQLERDLEQKR